jgi:RND family efflux transporter MFP subunit
MRTIKLSLAVLLSLLGMVMMAMGADPEAKRGALEMTGRIQPARTVYINASVPGIISKVQVQVGDTVKAGEIVAELDDTRYQLEVERARAKLEIAKVRLKAAKASEAELSIAEAELRQVETELRLAMLNLDATRLRAPIGGTVLARRVEVGQTVAPGAGGNLVELADLRSLEAAVDLAERDIAKVFRGQLCRVEIAAAPDEKHEGKVVRIRPTVDPSTATLPVHIEIEPSEKGGLVPGMFVRVTFLAKE